MTSAHVGSARGNPDVVLSIAALGSRLPKSGMGRRPKQVFAPCRLCRQSRSRPEVLAAVGVRGVAGVLHVEDGGGVIPLDVAHRVGEVGIEVVGVVAVRVPAAAVEVVAQVGLLEAAAASRVDLVSRDVELPVGVAPQVARGKPARGAVGNDVPAHGRGAGAGGSRVGHCVGGRGVGACDVDLVVIVDGDRDRLGVGPGGQREEREEQGSGEEQRGGADGVVALTVGALHGRLLSFDAIRIRGVAGGHCAIDVRGTGPLQGTGRAQGLGSQVRDRVCRGSLLPEGKTRGAVSLYSCSMKSDNVITVIVPVFNVAGYLDDCLRSVVAQTYTNLEILVVDDGSFDGSDALCDRWARSDPRITVIHQRNRGLSAARNIGLDHASGEFVLFVDPDDVVERVYAEKLHRAVTALGTPCAACGYGTETDGGSEVNYLTR